MGTQTREAPSPPTGHHQGEPEEAGQSARETASERKRAENMEPFLTTEKAAACLNVTERTLYRLLKAGKIPAVRVGRRWRFRASKLNASLGRAGRE